MSKTQEKVKEIMKSLDELKSSFENEVKELNKEVKSLEKRKSDLLEVKKKIDTSLISDPITLDIGGIEFKTTKSTLTKIPGTYFDAMFSGQFDIKTMTDKSSKFFIDRDGTHFRYILNFMRDGDLNIIPNSIKNEVLTEMKFYNFKEPLSDLINDDQFSIFNDWIDGTKKYHLIFKVVLIYGFEAVKFHSKCDNKGATITIIKSTDGNVFGGYNSQSWNSNCTYYGNNKCFLFTIINNNNVKPTKYTPSGENSNFVYGHSGYCPTFGGGHDLHMSNQCNTNNSSYQNFPYSYADATGTGKTTFANSYNFTVEDYEVFTVL